MLDLVIFAKLFPLTAGVSDNDSGDHLCAGSGDPALRQDRWKIGNIFVIRVSTAVTHLPSILYSRVK